MVCDFSSQIIKVALNVDLALGWLLYALLVIMVENYRLTTLFEKNLNNSKVVEGDINA